MDAFHPGWGSSGLYFGVGPHVGLRGRQTQLVCFIPMAGPRRTPNSLLSNDGLGGRLKKQTPQVSVKEVPYRVLLLVRGGKPLLSLTVVAVILFVLVVLLPIVIVLVVLVVAVASAADDVAVAIAVDDVVVFRLRLLPLLLVLVLLLLALALVVVGGGRGWCCRRRCCCF